MNCSRCDTPLEIDDNFCPKCGQSAHDSSKIKSSSFSVPPEEPNIRQQHIRLVKPKIKGLGFGVSGMILGILSLLFGIADFGEWKSGQYDFIYREEILYLIIPALFGLVFASLSAYRSVLLGKFALGICIAAIIMALYLNNFTA